MTEIQTLISADTPVLVTGGSGFIGSHLIERLTEFGAPVTVVDSMAGGHLENLNAVRHNVHLILGDLSNVLHLKRVNVGDFAYVFHLAGNPYIPPSVENPAFDFHENLENAFNLAEAIRLSSSKPRLVHISSAAVYGNPIRLPISETDPTVPISPYGVSKLAGERYVAVFSQLYGIRAAIVRFFSVYGPRQRKQVVFDVLRKLRDNPHEITVFGDGTQERDFAYVTDIVDAMLLAATVAPAEGEAYNVAHGVAYTINDLVRTWCEVLDIQPEIKYTGSVRPGDAEKWGVDMARIQALGFDPKVDLKIGLTNIRDWYDATFPQSK
ncbi:MAG: NAD-dependent epimerase/dehydratase family protein [Chitinophagaceae bacterium]|nr:NAD-dependent epimerase/dehydratase family protein [Anaerolineae bacterium]